MTEGRNHIAALKAAADPGAWLKLADLTIAPLDADAAAAWSAAYTRTMTELERARPLQPNRIAHHLSGCIWAKKKRTMMGTVKMVAPAISSAHFPP